MMFVYKIAKRRVAKEEEKAKKNSCVCACKCIKVDFVLGTVFFLLGFIVLTFLYFYFGSTLIPYFWLIFSVVFIFTLFCSILCLRWYKIKFIKYDKYGFIIKFAFAKQKKYLYKEIVKVRKYRNRYLLYNKNGKKIIVRNSLYVGVKPFMENLIEAIER